MDLPIDLSQISLHIKDKYLDEETASFSRWFIFGEHPDGTVDITCPVLGDILTHVPKAQAMDIITVRDCFVNSILELLRKGKLDPC